MNFYITNTPYVPDYQLFGITIDGNGESALLVLASSHAHAINVAGNVSTNCYDYCRSTKFPIEGIRYSREDICRKANNQPCVVCEWGNYTTGWNWAI